MTTMADMRARVRMRLEETTPAIWTDAEIDEGITGALEAYSWLFPKEATTGITVPANATSVALPTGAIEVRRVVLADGTVVPKRGAPRGVVSGEELAWEVFAGLLHFSRTLAAQTLTVWYTTAMTLADLPAADEGLIVLGGVAQALEARAIQEFKRGGPSSGASDHAPLQRAQAAFEREVHRRKRRVRAGLVSAP
jgi:hypothetical protein